MSAARWLSRPTRCCARSPDTTCEGATIGHLALGRIRLRPGADAHRRRDGMQLVAGVTDPISGQNLVSRRSFIFARAGFGKSNLNKLLFSQLYKEQPYAGEAGGRHVPVGTIIFDPDGEYFWPDDQGPPRSLRCRPGWRSWSYSRPAKRQAVSMAHSSRRGIRLDLRRPAPVDVISISLPPERQDQQNVQSCGACRRTNGGSWCDLIDQERQRTPTRRDCGIL